MCVCVREREREMRHFHARLYRSSATAREVTLDCGGYWERNATGTKNLTHPPTHDIIQLS